MEYSIATHRKKWKEEMSHFRENGSSQLKGFDYIELYVGNVHQATHFYRTAFGFTPVAYCGLETGARDQVSYVLKQQNIHMVLTSTLHPDNPIAEHVRLHGDGVKDIAFTVDHAEQAFDAIVRRGARPIMEPTLMEDDEGQIIKATIATCGETVHSLIQRRDFHGRFFPRFVAIKKIPSPSVSPALTMIDHVAISLERGQLDQWSEFYRRAMGFQVTHVEEVETEYSAMNSKVLEDNTGNVKFSLMEPAPHKRQSQIEEYLTYYRGSGVQHIAFQSNDLITTVKQLRSTGNEFLDTPDAYYEMLKDRVGHIEERIEDLREQKILVDRDQWGYLLQVFTKAIQGRPTLFMEAIQRKGARGFGSGNIKALFQALEYEQARRGNL